MTSVALAGLFVLGIVTAYGFDVRSQSDGSTAAAVDDKGNPHVPSDCRTTSQVLGTRAVALGAALLKELSVIGIDKYCNRLDIDTEATNSGARGFYELEGPVDAAVGFATPWGMSA